MKKINVLAITHDSKHTSAPLNEYTLARKRFYGDETSTLLAFYKNNKKAISLFIKSYENQIPELSENLEFLESNGSIIQFWKHAKKWLKEARKSRSRAIMHLHQPRSGFLAALIAKIYFNKIPIIYTVHSNYNNYSFKHRLSLFLCFLLSDKIAFVSNYSYDSFALFRKYFEKKSNIISNGADIERIKNIIDNNNLPFKGKTNELRLIATGIKTEKNQQFLLNVLENYKGDLRLEIYGDGPLKNELEREIIKKGLSKKVKILDILPREEFFTVLHNADIYISTSLMEGLPLAVMEAMVIGLPCIISDIPPHIELGKDLSGVSIVTFDIIEWHKTLDNWHSINDIKRKSIGLSNRDVINNNFTLQIMQEKYRDIYEILTK